KPKVTIVMTLTAIGCPLTGSILAYVEEAIKDKLPDIDENNIEIELTFDPPWNPDMVSSEGRELLKEVYGYDVVEEWKKNMQAQQTTS
ncbi:MAG: metal-sulfur cluster assembly factor, partial [Caldisphaera sp.]